MFDSLVDSLDLRDNCLLRLGLYSSRPRPDNFVDGLLIKECLFRPELVREDKLSCFMIGEIGLRGSQYLIGITPVALLSYLAAV
jgi:hypothetical protein